MTSRSELLEQMTVDLPEQTVGDYTIRRLVARAGTLESHVADLVGRPVPPGTRYTSLAVGDIVWMADIPPEREDHLPVATEIDSRKGRVLIAGLGIGMILRSAILSGAERVDILEVDQTIIDMVAPHYLSLAAEHNVDVRVFHVDVSDHLPAVDDRWTVAWFDVWEGVHDYRHDEQRLRDRFGPHADWVGFWGENWQGMAW